MKRYLTKCLLLCTAFAFTIVGCKKEPLKATSDKQTQAFLRSYSYFTDYPAVEDGMLSFRDLDHYEKYMSFLDSAITWPENNTDTVLNDPDDVLELLESQMSFTSLRHETNEAFELLNEIGWDDYRNIPEKHFIRDIALKSILNQDADVKIGDKIYHYISKNHVAIINDDATEILTAFHNLSESATGDQVREVDPMHDFSNISYVKSQQAITANVAKSTSVYDRIEVSNIHHPDKCNNPNKIRIESIKLGLFIGMNSWDYQASDFKIRWQIGGVEENYTSQTGELKDLEHTYPQAGTYKIIIEARPIYPKNLPYDVYYQADVTVPYAGCNFRLEKATQSWYSIPNTNKMIKCFLEIEQYDKNGAPRTKISSETQAFKMDNNKWKEHRGEKLVAGYELNYLDEPCVPQGQLKHIGSNSNAKGATTHDVYNYWISWWQVKGTHKLYLSGQPYGEDVYLRPCP